MMCHQLYVFILDFLSLISAPLCSTLLLLHIRLLFANKNFLLTYLLTYLITYLLTYYRTVLRISAIIAVVVQVYRTYKRRDLNMSLVFSVIMNTSLCLLLQPHLKIINIMFPTQWQCHSSHSPLKWTSKFINWPSGQRMWYAGLIGFNTHWLKSTKMRDTCRVQLCCVVTSLNRT